MLVVNSPRDDRAMGRQVLHDGAPARRRPADAGDGRLRADRRGDRRGPSDGRRASSSRSSDRWATGWCASAIRKWRCRIVRSLEQTRTVFYVQRAVDHGGRDIRVFVVGGAVLGAIERRAPTGEWRTNVAIGGSATPFELPDEWAQLALRAASGGRRRLRRRRSAALARRADLRARGQRHSRAGRVAAGDGDRRRRRDRRVSSLHASRASAVHVVVEDVRMTTGSTAADVAALAQLACLLEVERAEARQRLAGPPLRRLTLRGLPGQRRRDRPAFAAPADRPVGATIRLAIEATAAGRDQHESRHRAAAGAAGASGDAGRRSASCATRAAPGARRRRRSMTRAMSMRRFAARAGWSRDASETQDVAERTGRDAARGDAARGRPRRHRSRVCDRRSR